MTELPCLPMPQTVRFDHEAQTLSPGRFALTATSTRAPQLDAALARLNRLVADERQLAATQPVPLELLTETIVGRPGLAVPEGYRITIGETGVVIRARSDMGALHGLTTLAQLSLRDGGLPIGTIEDAPRFPWRGLLLDVARHFLSPSALRRTIDCMAAAKLNVLHLHLSDDQGFRFASAQFPRLASTDAYSPQTLAELVDYAGSRGVRIVPELDMPGHVTSWLTAYPEWGSQPVRATDRFGVHAAALNPTDEAVYAAIEALIGELAAVFPDDYLHIGGDEVHPQWWRDSAEIQAFMRAQGLADVAALQAYFNTRVRALLERHGRRMLVWDEALHPALTVQADAVTVQNWRGATTRDRALAAGHPCIVSAGYYLDLHYPAYWHYAYDPEAPQEALLALEDSLLERADFAHVAEGMRWTHQWRAEALPEQPLQPAPPVLGGEACMWGELVDEATLDVRVWSRLPAIAERLWSARDCTDVDSMYRRLAHFQKFLARACDNDLARRSADGLLAAGVSPDWLPLLDWFEPVKWYGRLLGEAALAARLRGTEMPKARPYQVHTPLDQVIDHLPVESHASRALQALAQQPDDAALREVAAQWQSLCARNDCPPVLQSHRDRLLALQTLVQQRLQGAALSESQLAALRELQAPLQDLLLTPAFALQRWLERAP